MQNRSLSLKVFDEKQFPASFRAMGMRYTQNYREDSILHYHNCVEIGLCTNGNGIEYIGDRLYSFYPNSIVVIQQGCIHDSHIMTDNPEKKPSEWAYVFVDLDALKIRSKPDSNFIITDADMVSLFWMMFHELEECNENYKAVFCHLTESFFLKANRSTSKYTSKGIVISETLLPAINCITSNYARELTVKEISESCCISESHFRKLFRKYMNCSPLEYLISVRLSVACKLLETTDTPVTIISGQTGFSSISSFNRTFKDFFGISPSQYRKTKI